MPQHQVYRNLNRGDFSVRFKGVVIHHARSVLLKNCEFHVSETGRQRVIRRGVRDVHAWVKGTLVGVDLPNPGLTTKVSYNPWKYGHFYVYADGTPVAVAQEVFFAEGYCWVSESMR